MTVTTIRNRIVTGCLAAMLLPVANAGLFHVGDLRCALTFGSPAGPAQTAPGANLTAPWFRETFILYRAEPTCPVVAIALAPPTATPAKALSAPLAEQPPGVVQNLRRTDRQ